jgi:RNA polymerase sigma factor (sigma-70 family)
VPDFYRFAAQRMRWVLLDMARRHRLRANVLPPSAPVESDSDPESAGREPPDDSGDPHEIAVWTEFHTKAGELPEREREVFELLWYHGLTHGEAARILGVHEKTVSYRWIRARLKLAALLPGADAPREKEASHAG